MKKRKQHNWRRGRAAKKQRNKRRVCERAVPPAHSCGGQGLWRNFFADQWQRAVAAD